MNIVLMRNNSLTNVVDKNLTTVTTHSNAKFLDPYDEYAPVIRVKGKTNWDDVNYIKIDSSGTGNDTFTRYYFIEGVTIKSPQIAIVQCRLDVLKTYSTFIKSLTCYLNRTADPDFGSPYLMDNRPVYPMCEVEKMTFRDEDDNIQGFVIPGETTEHQKSNGYYVMTTLQTGYRDPTVWPIGYTPVQPS